MNGPTTHPPRLPPTILVVDDEAGLREALALFFEGEGYQVLTARDGAEALTLLGRADLIVSDVRMPTMGGGELLLHLRARESPQPMLLLSGYSDLDAEVATAVGALALLRKPIDLPEVGRLVREALAQAGKLG